MTESELIDLILIAKANHKEMPNVSQSDFLLYNGAFKKINAYNLHDSNTQALTKIGYEVIESGGFEKWKAGIEQRENEIHQATISTARATVDAATYAKQSRNGAWVAAIAAVIAIFIPFYQSQTPKSNSKTDSTVSALRVKVDTLYSRLKDQSQIQKAKAIDLQNQRKK